jgi:hypothetical protein
MGGYAACSSIRVDMKNFWIHKIRERENRVRDAVRWMLARLDYWAHDDWLEWRFEFDLACVDEDAEHLVAEYLTDAAIERLTPIEMRSSERSLRMAVVEALARDIQPIASHQAELFIECVCN